MTLADAAARRTSQRDVPEQGLGDAERRPAKTSVRWRRSRRGGGACRRLRIARSRRTCVAAGRAGCAISSSVSGRASRCRSTTCRRAGSRAGSQSLVLWKDRQYADHRTDAIAGNALQLDLSAYAQTDPLAADSGHGRRAGAIRGIRSRVSARCSPIGFTSRSAAACSSPTPARSPPMPGPPSAERRLPQPDGLFPRRRPAVRTGARRQRSSVSWTACGRSSISSRTRRSGSSSSSSGSSAPSRQASWRPRSSTRSAPRTTTSRPRRRWRSWPRCTWPRRER